MKKLIILLLALILLPVCALCEDLSEDEQQYLGSWVMYMTKNDTTYLYTVTFFDDLVVHSNYMIFKKSALTTDRAKSGLWCGFYPGGGIVLSLGDDTYYGKIEDDRLVLAIPGNKSASGIYTRCPDLSFLMN